MGQETCRSEHERAKETILSQWLLPSKASRGLASRLSLVYYVSLLVRVSVSASVLFGEILSFAYLQIIFSNEPGGLH